MEAVSLFLAVTLACRSPLPPGLQEGGYVAAHKHRILHREDRAAGAGVVAGARRPRRENACTCEVAAGIAYQPRRMGHAVRDRREAGGDAAWEVQLCSRGGHRVGAFLAWAVHRHRKPVADRWVWTGLDAVLGAHRKGRAYLYQFHGDRRPGAGIAWGAQGVHRKHLEVSADVAGDVPHLRSYLLPMAPPVVLAVCRSLCS